MNKTTVPVLVATLGMAVLALLGVATAKSEVQRPPLSVDGTSVRQVIRGCGSEDGCTIDYRFGDRWIIRQVVP